MNPTPPSHPSDRRHPPHRVDAPDSLHADADTVPDENLELCEQDCAALEALFAAEFDSREVPADLRQRAERLVRVLGLLQVPPDAANTAGEHVLIDLTCARAFRARRYETSGLSSHDEDAIESLVFNGFDPARCPSALRERARQYSSVLSSLDVHISDYQRESLVSATLSRVQASSDAQSFRMRLHDRPRMAFKPRLADLVSVAAMLLLGTAVLAPMLGAVRSYRQRVACDNNMSAAGLGFGMYAQDNRDMLPMATSSPAGMRWWNVGHPEQSNSANLYTTLRTGYIKPDALACNGNPTACRETPRPGEEDWRSADQVSYSYQNLFAKDRPKWTSATRLVILADRSPVVPRAMRGEMINPVENSLNHAGTGQTVLFTDRSTQWLRSPVLKDGDNIWLPRVIEEAIARLQNPSLAAPLRGTETPFGTDDVFLGP